LHSFPTRRSSDLVRSQYRPPRKQALPRSLPPVNVSVSARVRDAARARIGSRRMAAEPYSKPSHAPCDDCVHRANCAASRLVCQAFNAYVGGRTRSAWQGLPRIPGKRLTLQARKAEAVDLPEGTVQTSAKLRRLGR